MRCDPPSGYGPQVSSVAIGQRDGDQLCIVSPSIAQNGPKTRIILLLKTIYHLLVAKMFTHAASKTICIKISKIIFSLRFDTVIYGSNLVSFD